MSRRPRLSVDDASSIIAALKTRFPLITGPKKDDICYATQNRQDAVKLLVRQCDVVIVVGSPNSSNSNRLREVAANVGVPAYLVDDAADCSRSGLPARRASASARARPPRSCWCRAWLHACARWALTVSPNCTESGKM